MNPHELKELKTRQAKLEAELSRLDIERKEALERYDEAVKKCDELSNKIISIKKEIDNSSKDVTVSEHALLRYIEREMGFDLEKIKDEILPEKIKTSIKTLGNGKYPIGRCKAVVKNMVVVSIV